MITWREGLAWAAGLFDGEGYVGLRLRRGRSYDQLQLAVTQADRRVLDRFAAIVGVGRVYGPYDVSRYNVRSKPVYRYVAVNLPATQAVIALLWEWLSPVKRAQVRAAMTEAVVAVRGAVGRGADRPACKHGHPFDAANTRLYYQKSQRYKSRACRICRNADVANMRARRRFVSALLEA